MTPTIDAPPIRSDGPATRRWAAGAAATVTVAALAGAAGLVFGFNALPTALEHRLPFRSPVVGGVALALIVAVPFAVLAVLVWRRDPRWHVASVACGITLVGWIGVELAVIRQLSVLHPMCAAVGAAFVWFGRIPAKETVR